MNNLWTAALAVLVAGIISIELGVSSAVAEIIAGAAVKHFAGFEGDNLIEVLGRVGLLTLMYTAGLEIDFDLMRNRFKESVFIGLPSFFLPFIVVSIVSCFFLGFNETQCFLLGIALSTTSLAIVYPQLRLKGPLSERRRGMLAAAMVTDLSSMIVFSFLFSKLTILTIELVAGLFVLTYIVPYLGKRMFHRFGGNIVEFEFKIILFVLLSFAIAAEHAGIEAALIAFLLGMITSQLVVNHANLQEKLQGVVFGFLAPIFFFWIGLELDLTVVWSNMGLLLTLFFLCFTAKFIGTYLPSRVFFPRHARKLGILFNARLTLGLIVSLYGLERGFFSERVFSAVVGCIILSSITSSALLRRKQAGIDKKQAPLEFWGGESLPVKS